MSECVSVLGSEKCMGVTNRHLNEPPLYEEWRGRKKSGRGTEERGGRESWKRRRNRKRGGDGEGREDKELEVTFQLSQSGSFRLGDGNDYNPRDPEARRGNGV